jgi:ribosomal 50S subunit-recycling heat shock protein
LRLDEFIKAARLLKSRSLAKRACDLGFVKLDGKVVKASKEVSPGQRIVLDLPIRYLEAEVLALPGGKNVSRKAGRDLVRVIIQEERDIDL